MSDITRADIFQRAGEKTPAFVRFSTVAGNKGSADLPRDVRGFAVKLYTKEGNWDIVGNNIPVFFIQDAIKFPDLIHAAKQEPDRGFPQAQTAHDNFWDFISLTPESMHMVMWIMSDRAIPRSFRFMEGFGVHTFRLVNAEGKSTFVKFHWKPKLGLQSVVWNEAVKINGADPDFHRRDLWNAIQSGDFPGVGTGPAAFRSGIRRQVRLRRARRDQDHPRGAGSHPPVGRLVLDRCVDNFFAETEQVAFCTQNIVPGIDFSERPVAARPQFLLPRHASEAARRSQLHPPAHQRPEVPLRQLPAGRAHGDEQSQRQGELRAEFVERQESGPREDPKKGFHSFPAEVEGRKQRIRPESFADHYSQARQFYISQTGIEQCHIAGALIFELSKVKEPAIRSRVVSHLLNIDDGLARSVASGLRLQELPKPADAARPTRKDLALSHALSILRNGPERFEGRKLGVLVTDGVSAELIRALRSEFEGAKAVVEIIAPEVGGVKASDDFWIEGDEKLDGAPSVLYDAVAVLPSAKGGEALAKSPAAKDFVTDAFTHCKYIACTAEAQPLFQKAGIAEDLDAGVFALKSRDDIGAFLKACGKLRHWDRGAKVGQPRASSDQERRS